MDNKGFLIDNWASECMQVEEKSSYEITKHF